MINKPENNSSNGQFEANEIFHPYCNPSLKRINSIIAMFSLAKGRPVDIGKTAHFHSVMMYSNKPGHYIHNTTFSRLKHEGMNGITMINVFKIQKEPTKKSLMYDGFTNSDGLFLDKDLKGYNINIYLADFFNREDYKEIVDTYLLNLDSSIFCFHEIT